MVRPQLTVGGYYVAGRAKWPEVTHLSFTKTAVKATLFCASPSRELIAAATSARAHFHWVDGPGVAMVALAFTNHEHPTEAEWFEAIYTPRTEMIGRGQLPGPPGSPVDVDVAVVDADTGLVAATRRATWSAADADFARSRLNGELARESTPGSERAFVESARRHSRASNGADGDPLGGRRWIATS